MAGPFGAGKTTHVRRFAEEARTGGRRVVFVDFAREGDSALDPSRVPGDAELIIIDHFDSLNLATGAQKDPPDLRSVAPLLEASNRRMLLATRRLLLDNRDEMVGQLTDGQRCAVLHVAKPELIELLPWSLSSLEDIALQSNDPRGQRLFAFLGQLDQYHGAELRRPLLLSMLLRVLDEMPEIPETGSLYEKYVGQTIAHDFDKGLSVITAQAKHHILRDLAFDIFTGQDLAPGEGETRITVANDRVSARVLEGIEQAGLRLAAVDKNYSLVQDFLDTNHLFGQSPPRRVFDPHTRAYEFRHPSFYDYFVGEAMALRYEKGHSLGLRPETFSAATLDSLAIYFAKRRLTSRARAELRNAVEWPKLSWPDRLLMLYHLEDEVGFSDLLAGTPADYRLQLRDLANSREATFITKAVKFQLVLLGEFDPYQYVADAREIEGGTDTHIEAQLQRGSGGSTEFLLGRLVNPDLQRAKPIAVYRLGQMGDRVALASLSKLRSGDPRLTELVDEAIERIERREGEGS